MFLDHLPLIERVAVSACRRAGMPVQDGEDFTSKVKVKLIEDDYAVLRKHRGDSKLTTYLTTVVHNLFKDFCNHKWGKFRHSAAAKKLGPVAKALERLLVIDRHNLETAIEMLAHRPDIEASKDELREIAGQLPQKSSRHFVDDEVLQHRASEAPEADAERRVASAERAATADRVQTVLDQALETLTAQDLLILKMFYRDGFTIAAIAEALNLQQRPLYSRRERCIRQLRDVFKARGLTWEQVREILGWQGREVRANFGSSQEKKLDESVLSDESANHLDEDGSPPEEKS